MIDFKMGLPFHQKPALIYTDIFELSIIYGNLKVEILSKQDIHKQELMV
jgi:hypothetical protein